MSSKSTLIGTQRAWAERSGVSVDERVYVILPTKNGLHMPSPLPSERLLSFWFQPMDDR